MSSANESCEADVQLDLTDVVDSEDASMTLSR